LVFMSAHPLITNAYDLGSVMLAPMGASGVLVLEGAVALDEGVCGAIAV
jgi:hypothetical protein